MSYITFEKNNNKKAFSFFRVTKIPQHRETFNVSPPAPLCMSHISLFPYWLLFFFYIVTRSEVLNFTMKRVVAPCVLSRLFYFSLADFIRRRDIQSDSALKMWAKIYLRPPYWLCDLFTKVYKYSREKLCASLVCLLFSVNIVTGLRVSSVLRSTNGFDAETTTAQKRNCWIWMREDSPTSSAVVWKKHTQHTHCFLVSTYNIIFKNWMKFTKM
jgi:hypothetical protein